MCVCYVNSTTSSRNQRSNFTSQNISLLSEFATRFQLIVLTDVMKFAFRAIIRASNQFNVFSLSRLAFVNITYVEIRTVIEYTWNKHNAIDPAL